MSRIEGGKIGGVGTGSANMQDNSKQTSPDQDQKLKIIHIAGKTNTPTPSIGDIVVFEYSAHVLEDKDKNDLDNNDPLLVLQRLEKTMTCFDSSRLRGTPLRWRVGDELIAVQAWTLALPQIHLGQSVWIISPPELAYGEFGMFPTIPPNSTIAYCIDLLAIETLVAREGAPRKGVAFVGDSSWLSSQDDIDNDDDDEGKDDN